jgi:hypothetical protein
VLQPVSSAREWLAAIIVAIGKDRRDIDVTEPKAKAVGMFKHRE